MTMISLVAAAISTGAFLGQVQDPRIDLQLAFPIEASRPEPIATATPLATISAVAQDKAALPPATQVVPTVPLPDRPSIAYVIDPSNQQPTNQVTRSLSYSMTDTTAPRSKEDLKKVNASFRNATVRDVLDWMQKQGVSFIVEDGKLDEKKRVTLNASNVPLGDLVDSLATALGGSWSRKGEMRVFQNHASTVFSYAPTSSYRTIVPARPNLQVDKMLRDSQGALRLTVPPSTNGRSFTFGTGANEIKKLLDSLTPAQKERQKSQGFLKLSDLTSDQRKLIGGELKPGEKFDFKIIIDGKELVIKND